MKENKHHISVKTIENDIEIVQVQYVCEQCKEGFMVSSDEMPLSMPPQYPSQCNKCGYAANMSKQYPAVMYRTQGDAMYLGQWKSILPEEAGGGRMSSHIISKLLGDNNVSYIFYCPGCKHSHVFYTHGHKLRWKFNEDMVAPTFTPSLLNRHGNYPDTPSVCHLYVRGGKIQYLPDCTHGLAGQTVDMIPVEDE